MMLDPVVRIRVGAGWKEDPRIRGALRAGEPGARAAAAREIVDVLCVEVDGVDIAAGRTEGPVVPSTEALIGAVGRLVAGQALASVPFQDGAVELVLRRRGGSALLSVVALGRPSRLLARDVEVDLQALATAARDAARSLCRDLDAVDPRWPRHPAARGLLRAAARLPARVGPAPERPAAPAPARAHRPRRRQGAPACAFELRDEEGLIPGYGGDGPDLGSLLVPGRVTIRSAAGQEILAVPGTPFLLLGDLAAAAGGIVAAVRRGDALFQAQLALAGRRENVSLAFDLARGTLTAARHREVPCPPLLAAQAFLEAAVDFCGAVLARNPRQAENGHLTELHAGASEKLALVREMLAGDITAAPARNVRSRHRRRAPSVPLGPGRVKRIAYRRVFEADLGPPAGEGLWRMGDLVVACGAEASLGLAASGDAVRWRGPGAAWAASCAGTLLLSGDGHLDGFDAATGRRRWSHSLERALEAAPRAFHALAGGRAALVGHSSVLALDLATGRTRWRFDPPAAAGIAATALGGLLVVGADTGLLYGVDSEGRAAWRHHGPGRLLAPPVPWGDACLALCETDRGAHLLALEASTGHRRWDALVDLAPVGPPILFAGLFAVAGTVGGDAVVVAIEPGGRQAWATAPSLGEGPLSLAPLRAGLAAKTAGGACAAFDRSGLALWSRARELPHPPPGNLPPIAARGVLFVPCDELLALDEATGARLGTLPGVAPARLLMGDDLSVVALDAGGALTGARLATHLSVV